METEINIDSEATQVVKRNASLHRIVYHFIVPAQ